MSLMSLAAAAAQPCSAVIVAAKSRARPGKNSKSTGKSKQSVKIKIAEESKTAAGSVAKKNTLGFGNRVKNPVWQCVQNCGACCKLDKGPDFPSPEEIFDDDKDIQLFKSLVGSDGWCIHYEKTTRKCSIYDERPYFCRVEPGIFETLFGIDQKKFNKEACSSCIDTIKSVYGSSSKELDNFNQAIWNTNTEYSCPGIALNPSIPLDQLA